jgi:hypothetical protein
MVWRQLCSQNHGPIGSGRWWTIYIGVRGRVVWDFCTSNSSTVSGAEVNALLEGEMIFTLRVHKQLHEVSFFVGPVLDRHHKPNFNQDVFLQSGLTTTCSSSRATAW